MAEVQTIVRRVNLVAKAKGLAVHVEGQHAEIVHFAAVINQAERGQDPSALTERARNLAAVAQSLHGHGAGVRLLGGKPIGVPSTAQALVAIVRAHQAPLLVVLVPADIDVRRCRVFKIDIEINHVTGQAVVGPVVIPGRG